MLLCVCCRLCGGYRLNDFQQFVFGPDVTAKYVIPPGTLIQDLRGYINEEESSDGEEELEETASLTRGQLLACYGLTENPLAQRVAKEKASLERKLARASRPEDSETD